MLSQKEEVIKKIQGFAFFQLKYNLIAFHKAWLFLSNLQFESFGFWKEAPCAPNTSGSAAL